MVQTNTKKMKIIKKQLEIKLICNKLLVRSMDWAQTSIDAQQQICCKI